MLLIIIAGVAMDSTSRSAIISCIAGTLYARSAGTSCVLGSMLICVNNSNRLLTR